MFLSKSRKVSLTLLCSLALLACASVAHADSLSFHPARDHALLNRMVKKRLPALDIPGFPGTNGAASDPPDLDDPSAEGSGSSSVSAAPSTSASSASAASSTPASSSAASASESTSSSESSSAASSSASASSASSDSSSAASSSSSSVSSTQSSATSSATTSASSASPTQTQKDTAAAQPTQQQQQQQDNSNNQDASSVGSDDQASATHATNRGATITSVVYGSQTPSTAGAITTGATTMSPSKTAITVIAVIAGCVAAVAIIWTIIRKTKFKKSSGFDGRMNPIDWQPSSSMDDHDPTVGGLHRTASAASHGSFHSSSAHGGEDSYGRAYGTSALQPIPDHDFTAGPATLAPVGGYADLARGPSPQPPMAQLNRGPSLNQPDYSYGVPLHHQGGGYDYNASAGARY